MVGLEAQSVGVTAVTLFEQFRGWFAVISRAGDQTSLRVGYDRLLVTHRYFCEMITLGYDAAAVSHYQSFRAKRIHIGTQDLRIAAITLANEATSNRRDFERVPGLRTEDWNQA